MQAANINIKFCNFSYDKIIDKNKRDKDNLTKIAAENIPTHTSHTPPSHFIALRIYVRTCINPKSHTC